LTEVIQSGKHDFRFVESKKAERERERASGGDKDWEAKGDAVGTDGSSMDK
jgi:hypothetical protein